MRGGIKEDERFNMQQFSVCGSMLIPENDYPLQGLFSKMLIMELILDFLFGLFL